MAKERPTPVPRGVVETIIDYIDEFGISVLIAISWRGKPFA